MLATDSYTLAEAIRELEERIETLEEKQAEYEPGTDQYEALQQRLDRVSYLRNGLEWQRDEEGWDGDATIEVGAMTAGEKAMMHREAPDAANGEEMRLWFAAASTVEAPYVSDDLGDTFAAIADCHPAFVEWIEAKANGLGVSSESGNRSSTSSRENDPSTTSTDGPDSTTSSSSASPTE
jgi:hypothetical protein